MTNCPYLKNNFSEWFFSHWFASLYVFRVFRVNLLFFILSSFCWNDFYSCFKFQIRFICILCIYSSYTIWVWNSYTYHFHNKKNVPIWTCYYNIKINRYTVANKLIIFINTILYPLPHLHTGSCCRVIW